jgi:uncharacterized protein YkwD
MPLFSKKGLDVEKRNALILCIFFLFLAKAVAAPPPFTATELANQKAVLSYVNSYRAKHHLKALQLNPVITAVAMQHSLDMAKHKIPFGHKFFSQRITLLSRKIDHSAGGAENVAYHSHGAQAVVHNWLASPLHRKNIEGDYNLTGIGVARDKMGRLYFTQIFLRTLPVVAQQKGSYKKNKV